MPQRATAPLNRSSSIEAFVLAGDARCPRAPACRSDRAALRDTSRAAPETIRSATRPPGDRRRVCAAATTAFASRAVVSEGAAREPPSRESARRTTTSRQADEGRDLPLLRDLARAATDRARAPRRETGPQSLRRPT